MNVMSTKALLLQYLEMEAVYDLANPKSCTTSIMSETLHISRSLTSQYLNELNKEGKLVKVTSRPVYYFSTKRLEEIYQSVIHEFEFYDLPELEAHLQKVGYFKQDFEKVIGSEGTLHYCITQMKSAMLYPNNGLPVILHGPKGCGKAYLAKTMYEFGIRESILMKSAKFQKEYITSQHDDIKQLFGSCEKGMIHYGYLESTKQGLLYLGNAGQLSEECQRRLALYIQEGCFTRVNDDKTIVESNTRIVLGIEGVLHEQLHEQLLLRVPVVCEVPSLTQRPSGEREELLMRFLQAEAQSLQRKLYLSRTLYQTLIHDDFHDSIHEMKKTIRLLCANGYAQRDTDEIYLGLQHLPMELWEKLEVHPRKKDSEAYLALDDLKNQHGKQQILTLFEAILQAHQEYLNQHADESEWLNQGLNAMRSYYDFIVFKQQDDDQGIKAIGDQMEKLMSNMEQRYQITLPLNCSFILTRMVYAVYRSHGEIHLWEHQRKDAIASCLQDLEKQLPEVTAMATSIISRIMRTLDVNLGVMNTIFLILNIHFYNRDVINRDTCGVIISHGYSTATSIADAANQMLETQVFKAIDMPLDTDMHQIQKKLTRFIQMHPYYRNLIIMVDMGSLEDIAVKLETDMNIGIINNISTGLALDIGIRILRHEALETILDKACNGVDCHYRILSNSQKEKVIVFTNDVGIKVSRKLAELFRSSLPKAIHLKFIEYDYERLLAMGIQDILFQKYEVILLVKPHMLKLEGIQSVSLEDLISLKAIGAVNEVLSAYLNEEEIESFNKQLLKNFSLQSIMENLTILNPSKLLDQVSDAMNQLQVLMNRKFQSKTMIGMYIHVSFLIERLITKTAIIADNMESFEKEHSDFIKDIQVSFDRILKNYSVEIPISEISYLYDYIQNEEWEEKA